MIRPRARIISTVASIFIGIAIMIGTVLIPSSYGIVSLATRISQEQHKASQALARAQELQKIATLIEQIQRDLPTYERMVIESGKEINFFANLEEKNKRHNLRQLIRLGAAEERSPSLNELPLEFQVEGTFPNILAYISELERAPELIALKSLTLLRSPTSPSDAKNPLSANLNGSVYVLKK